MMRAWGAGLGLLLVACGGKVVFQEDGGDGGGSSSSSPSSAAGTGPFEPGPVPDPRGDLCEAACAPTPGCENDPGCVENCLTIFGEGCDSFAAAYLQCFENGFVPSECLYTDTCEDEQLAWGNCPKNLCSDGCSLAEQDCSCLRNCDDRDIQMNCTMVADAQASCDCKIDGAVVSTCTETHLGCDLDFGCCAGAFGF